VVAAQLGDRLHVRTDEREGTIVVSAEAGAQALGRTTAAVNRVVDAYLKEFASQGGNSGTELRELSARRDQLAADRAAKEKALLAHRARTAAAAGDAGAATATVVRGLRQALDDANKQAATATARLQALDAAKSSPNELHKLFDAARPSHVFDQLDEQRAAAQQELRQLEAKLAEQLRTLLPQHPTVLATQRRIEALRQRDAAADAEYAATYRAMLQKSRDDAVRGAAELQRRIAAAEGDESPAATGPASVAAMEAALKLADDALADADRKLRDAVVGGRDSGYAVKLVQPAVAPSRPTSPSPAKLLAGAAIAGLLLGLTVAVVVPVAGRSR
jgi:uncharacterized protein involved in exopolysaccharide biosynthesis